MKNIYLLLLLVLLGQGSLQARQLYSIADGAWQDANTWNNQQVPATRHDTITIYHAVTLHSDLKLDSCFVHIKPTGGFCGDYKLTVERGSYLLNDSGYIGVYEMHIMDTVVNYGCLDVGEEGIMLSGGKLTVDQNVGSTIVHYGRQVCPFPCPSQIDTTLHIQVDTVTKTVSFTFVNQPGIYISFDYGDGHREYNYTKPVQHIYEGYGEFIITVIFYNCCFKDTVQRRVYFEPPPPPCTEANSFNIYNNPSQGLVWIEKDFCLSEPIKIRVFALTGQLVYEDVLISTDNYIKENINLQFLSSAFYIVEAISSRATTRKKICIVTDG